MVGQTTAVRPYPRAAESGARAKFNLCEIPYTYTPYLSLSLNFITRVAPHCVNTLMILHAAHTLMMLTPMRPLVNTPRGVPVLESRVRRAHSLSLSLSLSPTMSPTRGARALCGKTTQKKQKHSCFDLRAR